MPLRIRVLLGWAARPRHGHLTLAVVLFQGEPADLLCQALETQHESDPSRLHETRQGRKQMRNDMLGTCFWEQLCASPDLNSPSEDLAVLLHPQCLSRRGQVLLLCHETLAGLRQACSGGNTRRANVGIARELCSYTQG